MQHVRIARQHCDRRKLSAKIFGDGLIFSAWNFSRPAGGRGSADRGLRTKALCGGSFVGAGLFVFEGVHEAGGHRKIVMRESEIVQALGQFKCARTQLRAGGKLVTGDGNCAFAMGCVI